MKRLVVIPTYNERENLPEVVRKILALPIPFDLLVVDDGSPDGTGDLADRLSREDGRVHCLHRPRKEGLGRAYVDGYRWALSRPYEHIFQMDADLSHDPESLPALAAALEAADLVLGSRYIPGGSIVGWGLRRRALSYWGSIYSRLFLGLSVRDLTGGFKGYRREVLEAILLSNVASVGYSFQIESTYRAHRAGYRVLEVPIRFVDRRVGKSKLSLAVAIESAWRVPALRLGIRQG